MGNRSRFSPEVRERAVRLVFEQVKDNEPTWPIIVSVATKNRMHDGDVQAELDRLK